jgi:putative hydrolase of the HAD superfamily
MSDSRKVRALIFDFGGVISKTLFETHRLSEQALGLAQGTLTWRGPFSPESDPLWQSMQREQISERDYWLQRSAEVGSLLGEEWSDMKTLVQRARGPEPEKIVRPEITKLVIEAREQGLRLAVLSNELDLFYGQAMRETLSLLNHFELIVDATHTGILKPDARAYQACLNGLGLRAQDCLMIDDQRRNILGAQALGMPCVSFNVLDPESSCEEIRRHF